MANDSAYQLTRPPAMKTQMLIRKPVNEVFEAFAEPTITSQVWFNKSSGRPEKGREIEWEWERYNVSAKVRVKEIERDRRIVIDWGHEQRGFTTVEWRFTAIDDTTFVTIGET